MEENLQDKPSENYDLTNFPFNTATWCIFARDCRCVETCVKGCQNNSFSKTQEILNILIGRGNSLEHEQDEESVVSVRGSDRLLDRQNHLVTDEPNGKTSHYSKIRLSSLRLSLLQRSPGH